MSFQRGNVHRTRSQKHNNKTKFKNDSHDTSNKTKMLNNMEITDVCTKCKNILEWKIKYKKYKVLKAPKTCSKCHQKTVKNSYHKICKPCAELEKMCPKCGIDFEAATNSEASCIAEHDLEKLLEKLPEGKRRTIRRYISKTEKKKGEGSDKPALDLSDIKVMVEKMQKTGSDEFEDFSSDDLDVSNCDDSSDDDTE